MDIFIHFCDNLRVTTICYLYYDVQWFFFGGYGLSIEGVVAHHLHLTHFSLGVKVLDIIKLAGTLYLFM